MMSSWWQSLSRRFIFYIILFSSTVTIFSTGVQLYYEYCRDLQNIDTNSQVIEKSYLKSITEGLWSFNERILLVQLQGLLDLPDMRNVEIRKNDTVEMSVGETQKTKSIQYQFPLVYTYRDKELRLGTLHLTFGLDGVYQRLWNRVIVILITQGIKTFFVSTFIFLLFQAMFGRHLKTMAAYTRSFDLTKLDFPLNIPRSSRHADNDEIGAVITSINRMRKNLRHEIMTRKQDEVALRKSKEEWEKTFNAIPDIITLQDKNMCIIRANKAAYDVLAIKGANLIGKSCYDIFTGTSQPCPGCPGLETLHSTHDHSAIIVHKELGKTFRVLSAPILDSNNEVQYLVHIAQDITEQKNLEEQLFQAHKMEAIGTLAGGIAHDFNNILSAIIGFSELAKQDLPEKSSAREDIDQVIIASNRATDLVKQVLTFSRKSNYQLQSLMPHVIIKEALKMLRSSLPTTLSLEEKIDNDCGAIMADPTTVHQIVVNLCTNAFHAMENEKGTLAVSLCRKDIQAKDISESDVSPGAFVVLSVSDTGQGMDRKTLGRIFEPYFTTKEVGKGTGLGLAVIHGIVKDYKGFIQVESEIGKGSIFHVYFPALEPVDSTHDNTEEKPLSTGTERILIVDDEISIVNLNKRVLERLGYTVTATTSSKEALERIRLHPNKFDLLITDQTMPELSGVELAEEILKIRADIPIILNTGYSSVITEEGALAIGIRKYVSKPVTRTTLAKAVREVLDDK